MFCTFYSGKFDSNTIKITFTAESDKGACYLAMFGNKGEIIGIEDNTTPEEKSELCTYYNCTAEALPVEIFWDGVVMAIEYIDGESGALPIHEAHGQTIFYADI